MSENPHAGQGSVLLDIGGDVGALVVAMPSSMVGAEVEIDGLGPSHHHHHHRAHVAVVDRPVAHGSAPSLVFGELMAGTYALYDKGGVEVLLTAEVRGGEVTFVDWPDGATGAGEVV
jgi:hypothetical protein